MKVASNDTLGELLYCSNLVKYEQPYSCRFRAPIGSVKCFAYLNRIFLDKPAVFPHALCDAGYIQDRQCLSFFELYLCFLFFFWSLLRFCECMYIFKFWVSINYRYNFNTTKLYFFISLCYSNLKYFSLFHVFAHLYVCIISCRKNI